MLDRKIPERPLNTTNANTFLLVVFNHLTHLEISETLISITESMLRATDEKQATNHICACWQLKTFDLIDHQCFPYYLCMIMKKFLLVASNQIYPTASVQKSRKLKSRYNLIICGVL